MSSNIPIAPQGAMPAIGIPDSQDYPRLVYAAPYFTEVPLAELIEPSVIEAVENILPSLVPPYVDAAAQAAVQEQAVLLVGSTMSGPLFLSPLMPVQPSQAATMAYVDSMVATAGIPEVPPVPSGQVWARETGQWVPITPQTGVFLPLTGGSMQGNINMSGNTIQNMAAVPAMPNGAAPAQWVLNQIASVSLYQGTWNADNNVPDLTQLSTHVNAYTWIAITTAVDGVVIGPAIPGLQGMTVFNGDTIIYSTVQGQFMSIHAGGLTLPEADARYVQLAGSQMSGALLLNANASQPLQAVTYQQLEAFVPPGAVGEAPNDGQLYGRNGLTASWSPVLPLAGGILTGALTLSGNATANLNPVPLQQMTSAISAATAGLLPLAGGTMTGLMTLSGNAGTNLNPVPLQQLNSMLASYATVAQLANYLPLAGGTVTGAVSMTAPGTAFTVTNAATFGGIGTGSAVISGTGNALEVTNGAIFGGITAGSAAINGAGTALNVTNGASIGGTVSCGQTITSQGGRIISQSAANNPSVTVYDTSGAGAAFGMMSGGGDMYFAQMTNAGNYFTTLGMFAPNGNLTIVGTLTQGSDATNKTNIAPLSQGISLARQLLPKSFSWATTPDLTQWGFIAQDVEPVIPEAVTQGKTDPAGNPGTLSLDITAIIAVLVNSAQQLDRRCAALEANASITPPADDLA